MLDLNKLAGDLNGALAKVDGIATKAEAAIQAGGPEAIKVLEEVRTVLNQIGPALAMVTPLIGMLANFFPHATPVPHPPAGQQ